MTPPEVRTKRRVRDSTMTTPSTTQPTPMPKRSDGSSRNAKGIGATVAAVLVIIFVKAVVITAISSYIYGAVDPGGKISDNKIISAWNSYSEQVEVPLAPLVKQCAHSGESTNCKN